MRATTRVVHVVRGDNPVFKAEMVQCKHIVSGLALKSVQILDSEDVLDQF